MEIMILKPCSLFIINFEFTTQVNAINFQDGLGVEICFYKLFLFIHPLADVFKKK